MKSRSAARGGFTIIELLVSLVAGTILLAGVFQILLSSQRLHTARESQIRGRQSQLAGLDVLFGELREISPTGGDIISMTATEVEFRAQRKFGLACAVNTGTGDIEVVAVGPEFEVGDSLFIFSDGDEETSTDDTWHGALVTAVDTTSTCFGSPSHIVSVPGITGAMAVDSVRVGAPVRGFERYAYRIASDGGKWYLARELDGGTQVPMVGPLLSQTNGGLAFAYQDQYGNATTTAAEVAQILVTLRTGSDVRDVSGYMVRDSITSLISLRN